MCAAVRVCKAPFEGSQAGGSHTGRFIRLRSNLERLGARKIKTLDPGVGTRTPTGGPF